MITMINSCVVLIRKPCGHEHALLGVRASWAMLAAGLEVTVLIMGQGIFSVFGENGYLSDLYVRFLEQGGLVYAVLEDLEEAGMDVKSLPFDIAVIPASEVPPLVQKTTSVMTF